MTLTTPLLTIVASMTQPLVAPQAPDYAAEAIRQALAPRPALSLQVSTLAMASATPVRWISEPGEAAPAAAVVTPSAPEAAPLSMAALRPAAITSDAGAAVDDPPAAAPPPPAEVGPPVPVLPDPSNPQREEVTGQTGEEALIDGRRRPGVPQDDELRERIRQQNPGAIRSPAPEAYTADHIPVPDRWRIVETLGFVREGNLLDPYNQNTLKGDRPMCVPDNSDERHQRSLGCRVHRFLGLGSQDWFFVASAVSDTVVEPASFPIPVGVQSTSRPNSNDVFGINDALVMAQTFIVSAALIQGSTAYRPPDFEYRLTLAFQTNYVDVPERRILNVQPTSPSRRLDTWLGVQEAFVDVHLRDISGRYDFDSFRIGIQPLQFDFRGFLFNDNQLSFRLFGNRDNNRIQYNFFAVWRVEKDTNSGLNNLSTPLRNDWILAANIYRQDFPVTGLTSEAAITWNINREGNDILVDDNGFPVRPSLIGNLGGRNYDAIYLSYNADGRIGRMNLNASLSYLFGTESQNVFTGRPANISAFFGAAEASYDHNWIRVRGSALYSSPDRDPFDDTQNGYDAIFENPIFAGADTSYWIRQSVPFIGGARAVNINGRNGILNSLRSSKEQGQSNFVNPGTILLGVGADFDITPDFRLSTNANHLWFADTNVLRLLRQQQNISNEIGFDLSVAAIYRPNFNQNLVFRLSAAALIPTTGFTDLFENAGRDNFYYSVLFNAILTY